MAKAAKTKTRGANLPVPQSREAAAEMLAAIGADQRELDRIAADMNGELSRIKTDAEAKAKPIQERIVASTEGLKVWAEANRDALTDGGKVKTADLGTGKIAWRVRPPSVTLRGVDDILARLKALDLTRFIRTKSEVDKEAMLKEPEVARQVAGVSIGSEGEDFIVEPFAAQLSEVRP
jgi:phage host-nuclease inhibitor protein Gam